MPDLRSSARGASDSAQTDGVDSKTRTDRGDALGTAAAAADSLSSSSDAPAVAATRTTRTSARCLQASATKEREQANPSCVYYDSDEEHGVVSSDEEDELIASYPTIEEKNTPWVQRPHAASPVLKEATTGRRASESTTAEMLNDGYRSLQRSPEGESLEIGGPCSEAHTSVCKPGVPERAPEDFLMPNTISVGMHWVTGTAVSTQVSDCWLIDFALADCWLISRSAAQPAWPGFGRQVQCHQQERVRPARRGGGEPVQRGSVPAARHIKPGEACPRGATRHSLHHCITASPFPAPANTNSSL
jgi:hypothetical protein